MAVIGRAIRRAEIVPTQLDARHNTNSTSQLIGRNALESQARQRQISSSRLIPIATTGQSRHVANALLEQSDSLAFRHRLDHQQKLASSSLDQPHWRTKSSNGGRTGTLELGKDASNVGMRAHDRRI
jgi:hypothetical protein